MSESERDRQTDRDRLTDRAGILQKRLINISGERTPELGFLRRIVDVLPAKYNDNLTNFFVVHPTILSRVFMWFFTSLKGMCQHPIHVALSHNGI